MASRACAAVPQPVAVRGLTNCAASKPRPKTVLSGLCRHDPRSRATRAGPAVRWSNSVCRAISVAAFRRARWRVFRASIGRASGDGRSGPIRRRQARCCTGCRWIPPRWLLQGSARSSSDATDPGGAACVSTSASVSRRPRPGRSCRRWSGAGPKQPPPRARRQVGKH